MNMDDVGTPKTVPLDEQPPMEEPRNSPETDAQLVEPSTTRTTPSVALQNPRLRHCKELIDFFVTWAKEGDLAQGDIAEMPALLSEVDAAKKIRDETSASPLDILRTLELVQGVRGPGTEERILTLSPERAFKLLAAADDTVAKLDSVGVERGVVYALLRDQGLDPETAYLTLRTLLTTLQLAVGWRRKGGFLPNEVPTTSATASDAELVPFEEFSEEVERADAEQDSPDEARPHESAYYRMAQLALERKKLDAYVTGVSSRRSGQWSTPDVVGVAVYDRPAILLPIVRVVTVEVKHKFTLDSVAEARSHLRFANSTYLAVYSTSGEVTPEQRRLCVEAGIGLMCRQQANSSSFYEEIEAPLHHPDELAVDDLLRDIKLVGGQTVREVVAKKVRASIFRNLFTTES